MELDDFLAFLEEDSQREKVFMVNPQRQIEFASAYRALERLINDEEDNINARIWCEMGELINGYAVIHVEADWIVIREIDKFYAAAKYANNFEIYATEDCTLRMNITFHGVRTRIK